MTPRRKNLMIISNKMCVTSKICDVVDGKTCHLPALKTTILETFQRYLYSLLIEEISLFFS